MADGTGGRRPRRRSDQRTPNGYGAWTPSLFLALLVGLLGSAGGQDAPLPGGDPAAEIPFELSITEDDPAMVNPSDLESRFRTLEQLNRELADQMDEGVEVDEGEIRQILSRYETLLDRWSQTLSEAPTNVNRPFPGGDGADASDRQFANSPVPDYTEGSFTPFQLPSFDKPSSSTER